MNFRFDSVFSSKAIMRYKILDRFLHLKFIQKRCKKLTNENNKQYSHTICLPKSSYPVRFDRKSRVELDEKLRKICDLDTAYHRQLTKNDERKLYVIHDGPPYANGDVHVGHAVNKIFKDIVLRYKSMTRYRVHFRPGWDCHGLPIELKCVKNTNDLASMKPLDIRGMCKIFASETIEKQMASFKRWACLGDWSNRYTTMDKDYESKELEIFYNLYKSGYIYRSFMPVHWSPSSRTALAEAELEYNPSHKSLAVYCRFLLVNFPREQFFSLDAGAKVYAVVWTTTPWTLPLNDAVCFKESENYFLLGSRLKEASDEFYICSERSSANFIKEHNEKQFYLVEKFSGEILCNLFYVNPMRRDSANPFLHSDHVDAQHGTGLVHCSYAHGFDDFEVARRYGKVVECYVDEAGCYSRDLDLRLAGKNIHCEDGVRQVLTIFRPHLMSIKDYVHSYPYDWRTRQPTIVRVSLQWFVDCSRLTSASAEILSKVNIYGRNTSWTTMTNMLASRNRWCISRQRTWGVPIPAFYRADDKNHTTPIVDELIVERLKNLFLEYGSDCWWSMTVDELITDEIRSRLNLGPTEKLIKGDDILDIWFDSGVSWASVLPENHQTADLIVEGPDQFRGWFQSLLLTSVASGRGSPYSNVLVHGFAVDENEQKMSKSLGNVVIPDDVINDRLGVDGLRFWAANQGAGHDKIVIGPIVLGETELRLTQIRKTLRFVLGNLNDFRPEDHLHTVPYYSMPAVDKYMLHLLAQFERSAKQDYDSYKFNTILFSAHKFSQETLSAFYSMAIKDRLYCDPVNSPNRRSAQIVLHWVGLIFTRCLAPILPYFAEEYYSYAIDSPAGRAFESGWVSSASEWINDELAEVLERSVLPLRKNFLSKHGSDNFAKYHLKISASDDDYENLHRFQSAEETSTNSQLLDFFRTSLLTLTRSDTRDSTISVDSSQYGCCLRCRLYVCRHNEHLCQRCSGLVREAELIKTKV